jgi:mannose/cellobiose epimerase-like protein (N-acyl-D-glucosamine 2-epimerase family)
LLPSLITSALTIPTGIVFPSSSTAAALPAKEVLRGSHQASVLALAPFSTKTARLSSDPRIRLPNSQRWLGHLQQELLPFWTLPTALGTPIGNFPSIRCNDGSLLDRSHPCSEIKDNAWLMLNRQYVVSLSRQIYTYGVAFHLTGDTQYLTYAKAGVNYLRQNAFDRKRGGAYAFWDGNSQSWGPAFESRNPQEQAYALLGISYYYYLTRDPEVLPDILALKTFIFKTYYSPDLNLLQWQLQDGDNGKALDKRLTAQLDQLNAYMLLLTPILPEPYQTEWKQDMIKLSKIMLTQFYSPKENLFFLSANSLSDQDIRQTDVDFGHTIKAMWMLREVGLVTRQQSLVSFVDEHGPRVLERAYLPASGSWGSGIRRGGDTNVNKEWWVYAELDQFAASLALDNPSFASYLPQTYRYWFNHFVDQCYGEVWSGVDGLTTRPLDEMPKQWPWKNGYHSFEHALVGYITASQLHREPVVLYYAFEHMPSVDTIHPYFYQGKIDEIKPITNRTRGTIYKITFSEIK